MHFLISAGIFILDFFIKNNRETHSQIKEYGNGTIRLTTCHNRGAFLNSGENHSKIIAFFSTLFTGCIGFFFLRNFVSKGKASFRLPWALLLGGACSNTYDRLQRGYVVDYLQFPKCPGKLRYIVYNFSDFCIFLGSVLLFIRSPKS